MFEIYLASLIFGGILLIASLLFGGEHGDTNADTDHALDADHSGELSVHDVNTEIHESPETTHELNDTDYHSADGATHHQLSIKEHQVQFEPSSKGLVSEAAKFFSFRNIVYFLAFFGLTGTSLTLFSISGITALLSSLGIGVLASFTGYKFLKYLRSSESGEVQNIYEMHGKLATVRVPMTKSIKGQVIVETGAKQENIIALIDENSRDEHFNFGEKVLIIEIRDGIAYIIKNDITE